MHVHKFGYSFIGEYETGDEYGYSFIDENENDYEYGYPFVDENENEDDENEIENNDIKIDNIELITQEDIDEWELSPFWECLDLREYLRIRDVGFFHRWAFENGVY